MDFQMEAAYDAQKNCWQVTVSGEIDIFNSPDMKKRLMELIEEKQADLYLNCQNLDYLDSTALGALVAVLKNVKGYEGEMHLLQVKPSLNKLFKITNLDKVFIIEGDAHE